MNNNAQNGSFCNVTDNQILLTDRGQDAFYHASNQLLMQTNNTLGWSSHDQPMKQVNRETQNLTPRHAQTPLAIVIQIGTRDYIMDLYACATVRHDPPRRFVSAHAWLCAPKRVSFLGVLATRYTQGPWTDFDAKYAKTCGSAQGCAFSGLRT